MATQLAVEAVNVEFKYARNIFDINTMMADPFMRRENPPVLQKISIAAPKGKIYALLGSSGCGKTTLLKCILGQLQPKAGSIKIFGCKPGSTNSPVPGPGVGYMPQELSLFSELTVRETFRYFGRLYLMSAKVIEAQTDHIISFLHLPDANRIVKKLSGGQQRRVSLACALIHRPPLMILDEPTVGVDPLLRVTIWNYLEELCRDSGLTVILTTHYIEEARSAETIGLMRNGQLLVQDNPEVLLTQHNLPRLEDIFLKLCVIQDSGEKNDHQKFTQIEDQPYEKPYETPIKYDDLQVPNPVITYRPRPSSFNLTRFSALFAKNCITFRRNLAITLVYCLLPAIQFTLFMFCTGNAPSNIPIAIANEEYPPELSGKFIDALNPEAIRVVKMRTVEEAEKAVVDGRAWVAMHFYSNYSTALDDRRVEFTKADEETIQASNIHMYLDHTHVILGVFNFYNIMLAFQSTMNHWLKSVDNNPNAFSLPFNITEVVYGTLDLNSSAMTEFIIPGVIILIAFFSTAAISGLSLILEQKDGLLKRSQVAGVKPMESLFAHVATQTMVLVAQQVVLFLTIFALFGIPSRGPLWIIFSICFLQGIAGIMYGLFISSLFPDEVSAAVITMGSFLPTFMVSGIMWPIRSISIYLHYISLILPQTLAMNAIRSVLSKGWSLEYFDVWVGFVASGSWILIFLIMAAFLFSKFI